MRRFIPYFIKISIVLMVISFIGQQVSATKNDVERALDLLRQARAAIGGDAAISSIQSLSINGKSNRHLQTPDQGDKQLSGDFELNMMLPDRLIRIEKIAIGTPETKDGAENEEKRIQLKDTRVKIIREVEGSDQQKAMHRHDQSEIARYMLGLLLTPPATLSAAYNYIGEGDVDGARADVIEIKGSNEFTMKLYLDRSSHLPMMMSYQGYLPRIPAVKDFKTEGVAGAGEERDVVIIRGQKDVASTNDGNQVFFERKVDGKDLPPGAQTMTFIGNPGEKADIQVRFADFRNAGGVMLPHTLTHVVNGKVDSIWIVEKYEINSPTAAEKFHNGIRWSPQQN